MSDKHCWSCEHLTSECKCELTNALKSRLKGTCSKHKLFKNLRQYAKNNWKCITKLGF